MSRFWKSGTSIHILTVSHEQPLVNSPQTALLLQPYGLPRLKILGPHSVVLMMSSWR